MDSLFDFEQETFSVAEIMHRFKIKWKSQPAKEEIKCPHCRRLFRQRGEEGLEELLYSVEPKLYGLTERSTISKEIFDTVCSILKNDDLER